MGEETQIDCHVCKKTTKAEIEDGLTACKICGCVDESVKDIESMYREQSPNRTEGDSGGERGFNLSKDELDRTHFKHTDTYGGSTEINAFNIDADGKKIGNVKMFQRLRAWDNRITRSKADTKWKNKKEMLLEISKALFREVDEELKKEFSRIYQMTLHYSECSECDCSGESKTTDDGYCVKCNHSKKIHKYSLEKGRKTIRMMLGAYCVALKRLKINPPFNEIEKIISEKMIPGVNINSKTKKSVKGNPFNIKKRVSISGINSIFQYYELIVTTLGIEKELPIRTAEDDIIPVIRKMYATPELKFDFDKITQNAIDIVKKAVISTGGIKRNNVIGAAIFLAFKKEGIEIPEIKIMSFTQSTNIISFKKISREINDELKLGLI